MVLSAWQMHIFLPVCDFIIIITVYLKQLLTKVKEASSKAGLHLNMKMTKIMPTEEAHNFT